MLGSKPISNSDLRHSVQAIVYTMTTLLQSAFFCQLYLVDAILHMSSITFNS